MNKYISTSSQKLYSVDAIKGIIMKINVELNCVMFFDLSISIYCEVFKQS